MRKKKGMKRTFSSFSRRVMKVVRSKMEKKLSTAVYWN